MSARPGLHVGELQWVADLSEPDAVRGVLVPPALVPARPGCEGSSGAPWKAEVVRSQGGAP